MSSRKQRRIIQDLIDRNMFVAVTTYALAGTYVSINTGSRVRSMPISIAGEMVRRIKEQEWNQMMLTTDERKG